MKSYALIADPDASSAVLYAAAAREEGLSYVSVRDGALALSVLGERGAPDLLVTEMALPNVCGPSLIEQVRRAPGGGATVIVVVSADRDQREQAAAMRARLEIGAVLAKAASAESVRRVIKRLLAGGEGEELRLAAPKHVSSSPPPSFAPPSSSDAAGGEVRASGVRVRGPFASMELRAAAAFGGSVSAADPGRSGADPLSGVAPPTAAPGTRREA